MLLKNRVRDAKTKKIIGYERINKETGQWEHLRAKRKEWLLGAITSEDSLIREPWVGLSTIDGTELYLKDKVKHYVNDTYGWRVGEIRWDDVLLTFTWVCNTWSQQFIGKEDLMVLLSGNNNLGALKFEL